MMRSLVISYAMETGRALPLRFSLRAISASPLDDALKVDDSSIARQGRSCSENTVIALQQPRQSFAT